MDAAVRGQGAALAGADDLVPGEPAVQVEVAGDGSPGDLGEDGALGHEGCGGVEELLVQAVEEMGEPAEREGHPAVGTVQDDQRIDGPVHDLHMVRERGEVGGQRFEFGGDLGEEALVDPDLVRDRARGRRGGRPQGAHPLDEGQPGRVEGLELRQGEPVLLGYVVPVLVERGVLRGERDVLVEEVLVEVVDEFQQVVAAPALPVAGEEEPLNVTRCGSVRSKAGRTRSTAPSGPAASRSQSGADSRAVCPAAASS